MSCIHRFILSVAVVTALAAPAHASCYFGECGNSGSTSTSSSTAPKPETAASTSKVLATYGSWDVVVGTDGRRMVVDTFDDDSKLVIGKVDGEYAFLLINKTWTLTEGDTITAKINIDGEVYTGTAKVLDGQTYAISGVSQDVMKAINHGNKATITIADDSWDLNLPNAASALDAAAGNDSRSIN